MSACYCRLPPSHCCCAPPRAMARRYRFDLWLHPEEWALATNTARLAAGLLDRVHLHRWYRLRPAPPLTDQACLLFPADRAPWPTQTVTTAELQLRDEGQILVLDGSWKQCRKMLRQSPWLQQLPRLELPGGLPSHYPLRRGAGPGQLCTAEAIAATLRELDETAAAEALEQLLQRFYTAFLAHRSGHLPRHHG